MVPAVSSLFCCLLCFQILNPIPNIRPSTLQAQEIAIPMIPPVLKRGCEPGEEVADCCAFVPTGLFPPPLVGPEVVPPVRLPVIAGVVPAVGLPVAPAS
jgi:hypothetical protein